MKNQYYILLEATGQNFKIPRGTEVLERSKLGGENSVLHRIIRNNKNNNLNDWNQWHSCY